MRRQYLFFDLDGTLTDPFEGITRSVAYALGHFGIEVGDRATLSPFIGPPLRESFRERYGMSDAEADVAVARYRTYFNTRGIFENKVYDGIPELLGRLRKAGATLVMATSKPTPFARRIAVHFGFAEHFTLICGSLPDGRRSAKAEVIRYALARLRIDDPATALMIGDRRYDIEGAAAAGMDAIGVLWGYGSREELLAAGATRLAADLRELEGLLL